MQNSCALPLRSCFHSTVSAVRDWSLCRVQVSAKVVKELREKSGAGMMDCKKALAECDGDLEAAADYLRKKGLASAGKKAGRVASEGAVGAYIHAGSRHAPLTPSHWSYCLIKGMKGMRSERSPPHIEATALSAASTARQPDGHVSPCRAEHVTRAGRGSSPIVAKSFMLLTYSRTQHAA